MEDQQSVPMLDQSGKIARMIPADKVSEAQSSGWQTAAKMVGRDGKNRWIPTSQVGEARENNFALTPDNPGAQKMVTPQGQVTYALPNEVGSFTGSGHTLIRPDGNYSVTPLPGEDFSQTADRAVNVVKALGQEGQNKAMQAEKSTLTPARVGTTLAVAPMMGLLGTAGVAGVGNAAITGGPAAGSAAVATGKLAVKNPVVTAIAVHLAREMGVPLPKLLDVLGKLRGE